MYINKTHKLSPSIKRIKEEYDKLHKRNFQRRVKEALGDERFVFEYRLKTPWHKIVQEFITKTVSIKGKNILEIGCGYGSLSVYLSQLGAEVNGIDLSTEAIKIARRNAELFNQKITFQEADAIRLPFKNERFDIVVCCDTLEHIPQYKKAIVEICRTTKRGGHIIITTPNLLHPKGIYLKLKTNQPIENIFFYWTIKNLLKKEGIKILEIKSKSFFLDKWNSNIAELVLSKSLFKIFGLRIGVLAIKK